MSKKDDIADDERQLFRDAVKDVRRLKGSRRIQPHGLRRPSPRPRQRELDEQQVLQDMMSDPVHLEDVETGEELLFTRNGLQQKLLKKLRRGELSTEAELDLHGYTVAEARQAIAQFLPACRKQQLRVVRIIHGKGYGSFQKLPVLKTHVAHWLKQRDEVLAYCSARPVDGGTGAVYVLLKAN